MSHSTENLDLPPSHRPCRVAFVITELDPGGAERQLVRLATNLDRSRFDPEVVCLAGPGELAAALDHAGVPVTCLGARGRWDAGVVFRLWRHLRRTRPDLVQTFLFHANIAGRVAARLAGVPVVISGIRVAEMRHRWHLRLDRLTDRLVDRHVCVSNAVAEFSARVAGLPAQKLVVIPNAVDADRFATAEPADVREFGFPLDSHVLLFVGRLDEQKDPLRLLEAYRLLVRDFPSARLLFVGTGPLESTLRRQSNDLGDRVRIAGYRRDVPRLLKAAECLVLPSRWEGMPNVVLEAMAAGTPVVATDAPGVGELLDGGTIGAVVRASGPVPLAAAIGDVLRSTGHGASAMHQPQNNLLQRYTTDRLVESYQEIYSKLLVSARETDPGRPVPADSRVP